MAPKRTEEAAGEVFPGCDLTPDEVEFGMAMERYKRRRRRPFPAWHEVLRVVRQLGYQKLAPPGPEPPTEGVTHAGAVPLEGRGEEPAADVPAASP